MAIRKQLIVLLPVALIVAGLFIGHSFVAQPISTRLPTAKPGYKWQQVFADDFTGSKIDSSKWTGCYDWVSSTYNGCTNSGNNELEWYAPGQVTVGHGYAQLTAIPQNSTGLSGENIKSFPYRSGMLSTGRSSLDASPKATFTYGFFEARMKVTSGKGVWPAFWLLPADHSWPPEIDVMEILGDKPDDVLMTSFWGGVASPQKDSTIYSGLANPNDWHTYAIDWQPGYIGWYIDGTLRKSIASSNVPTKPMEIIANLAIGGNLAGTPDSSTKLPATLDIDYIHVYSQVKR